ncbi:MAG: cupin domain-containing protein [Nitrospirota bacterium]
MSEKERTPTTCDWKIVSRVSRKKKTYSGNKSKFYKHNGNFTWQGIKTERYKLTSKDWSDIIRQTLIGKHGETPRFHVRYFEIAPRGYSSFEVHKHEHVVICIRGKGKVLVGKKIYDIKFLDTLYIAPNMPHQLRNPSDEPFGFFCIVNAKRDKPKILNY